MRVVITGGAGFIGLRLAARLLQRGTLAGPDGRQAVIDELVLFDMAPVRAPLVEDRRVRSIAGDIADRATVAQLINRATATVFHLAAVVSAEAEADTDKGWRVNLDGTRAVLEACRGPGTVPRLVFASSLAVYGGALPAVVGDDAPARPQTSYGAQKAVGELLVNDYHRKGFIDGRAVRLPTIIIRPGRPNRAASAWASALFREPLAGSETVCPVSRETAMALLSPRRLVAALERVHDLPAERLGADRTLQLPAITATVTEMVEALRRAGGNAAVARIRWQPDPATQRIVDSWPRGFAATRARSLGLEADSDIDAIVQAFVADDLAMHQALQS